MIFADDINTSEDIRSVYTCLHLGKHCTVNCAEKGDTRVVAAEHVGDVSPREGNGVLSVVSLLRCPLDTYMNRQTLDKIRTRHHVRHKRYGPKGQFLRCIVLCSKKHPH